MLGGASGLEGDRDSAEAAQVNGPRVGTVCTSTARLSSLFVAVVVGETFGPNLYIDFVDSALAMYLKSTP